MQSEPRANTLQQSRIGSNGHSEGNSAPGEGLTPEQRRGLIIAIVVAVLVITGAVAIEYLQYLVPTRHARLHDAGIKAMGAAIGLVAGWVINRWRDARSPSALPLAER